MKTIVITTSSFAEFDQEPLKGLKENGINFVMNPYGRKLSAAEVIKLAARADGLIAGTESLDSGVLENLKNLKVISRCGAGLDNVDLPKAKELNIKVFSTPDAPTLAVAELTVGLIFCALRRISFMDRQLRLGKWDKVMGNLLAGKCVGVIGMGKIGLKVAKLLQPFSAELYFTDPYVSQDSCPLAKKVSLSELLSLADIVTIHVPYRRENEYIIDAEQLSFMKKSSILVNCSRGKIVDEKALYCALKEGRIAFAAVDVFENEPYAGELISLDNVILTPHIGSYAVEARVAMEKEAVKNLLRGFGVQN